MSAVREDPRRLDLDELLVFWKPRLGLQDWVIRAEYDRVVTGLGETTIWWRDREARVRIREPYMSTHDWPPVDVELTFVHELVHCIVEPILHEASSLPLDLREQIVEQLAKGYVRCARRFPIDPDWIAIPGSRVAPSLKTTAKIAGGNNRLIDATHEIRLLGEEAFVAEEWTDGSRVQKRYGARLPFSRLVHLVLNTTEEERAEIDARADWRGVP